MSVLEDITEDAGINVTKALKNRDKGGTDNSIKRIIRSIYSQYFTGDHTIDAIAAHADKLKMDLKSELKNSLLAWQILCGLVDQAASVRMETIYNNKRKYIELSQDVKD